MEQLKRQLDALKIELSTEKQKSYSLEQELGYLRQKQRYDKSKTPHSSHENLSRTKSDVPSRGRSVSLPGPKLPENKRDYIQLSEDDDEDSVEVGVKIAQGEDKSEDKAEDKSEGKTDEKVITKYEVISRLNTWVSFQEITKNAVIRDVKSGNVETVEEIKGQITEICAKTVKKSVGELIKTKNMDLEVLKNDSVPKTSVKSVGNVDPTVDPVSDRRLADRRLAVTDDPTTDDQSNIDLSTNEIPTNELSTNDLPQIDITIQNIETAQFVFNKISLASMINQWDIAFSATLTQRELREQPRRLINSFLSTKDEKVLQIAKISLPKVVLSQAEKELIKASFKKWKCLEIDDEDQNAKTKLARTASTVVFRNLEKEDYETVKREEVLSVCQGIRKRILMFQEIYDKHVDSEYSSDDESEDEAKIVELAEASENVDVFTADGDLVDENTRIVVREVQKPICVDAGLGVPSAPVPPGAPPPPMMMMPSKSKQLQPAIRLPKMNWQEIETSKVKITIFSDADYRAMQSQINLRELEDMFKLGAHRQESKRLFKAREKSLLVQGECFMSTNRHRNVGVTLKRFKMSLEEISLYVKNYDLEKLNVDRVTILIRLLPNEFELKSVKKFEEDGGKVECLSEEDRFIFTFGREYRIAERLSVMKFIGEFLEEVYSYQPKLDAVIAASRAINHSAKLKKVFEIMLAIGNHMNRPRQQVQGFKPVNLYDFIDCKSRNDKKQRTLLHFIVQLVKDKFPDFDKVYEDLEVVKNAKNIVIEYLAIETAEIKNYFQLTTLEYEQFKSPALKAFLDKAEKQVSEILKKSELAEMSYQNVVRYFGGKPFGSHVRLLEEFLFTSKCAVSKHGVDLGNSAVFFKIFNDFALNYKKCESDLEIWRTGKIKRQETEASLKLAKQRRAKRRGMLRRQKSITVDSRISSE